MAPHVCRIESSQVAMDSRKELESLMKQALEQKEDMRERLAQVEHTIFEALGRWGLDYQALHRQSRCDGAAEPKQPGRRCSGLSNSARLQSGS